MKIDDFLSKQRQIGIVGLGYVGLPLAEILAKKFKVVGIDINPNRIEALKKGIDSTRELTSEKLRATTINFTTDFKKITECSVVIVTVPTPIDKSNNPDLTPVRLATQSVGEFLKSGTIIVYESTVYPGVTEEFCVPILEEKSHLKWKKDFYVGYSPERVNPGDKNHTIDKIKKVVSGDGPETLEILAAIYGEVITAGVYRAPNIKTAEAAKVIENTQRDLNIAFMNELSIIFNKMGLNTLEVIEAAKTKWNFLPFYPGLVGGHCIGVDPYYLTHKAETLGHHPQVILAGRRINDRMGQYVAEQTIKKLVHSGKSIVGGKILICGFTFKENVPDIRNTKVIDIYKELIEYGACPVVYDPVVNPEEMFHEYGFRPVVEVQKDAPYLAVILAVKHEQIIAEFNFARCRELQTGVPVVIDIKGILSAKEAKELEIQYYNL